jgi:hypothetical protein
MRRVRSPDPPAQQDLQRQDDRLERLQGRPLAADTVEQMPHITQRLQELWGTQEAQAYIHQILRDNRNGTRQGFP